jgi:hypothetical protein
MKFSVLSYSLITNDHFISSNKNIKRENNTKITDINRDEVYSEKITTFGRLSSPDKLAFSAASLAISAAEKFDTSKTGIVLLNSEGSIERDRAYMDSVVEGFARPNLFPSTLPSSPVAEIAITFELKGPDRVLVVSNNQLKLAFENSFFLLKKSNCSNLLLTFVELGEKDKYAGCLLLSSDINEKYPTISFDEKIEIKNFKNLKRVIETLDGNSDFLDINSHS